MRPILSLLLALLMAPMTLAQAPLLEDPAGDVGILVANTAPLPQAGTWTAVDVRALNLTEDPAGFTFEVRLEDLGEDGPRSDYGNTQVRFGFHDCTFYVNQYRSSDNAAYFGNLYRMQGETSGLVRGLRADRDLAADRIWTTVDRFDFACDGRVPGRGDVFDGIRVVTYANLPSAVGSGVLRVGDAVPDSGDGATYTVLFGGGAAEGARLETATPFRSSNGEAATYQFDLSASHEGDEPALFRVFVENLPGGWNISLPGEVVELPPGRPVAFPLFVTTVFRHQHGTAEAFQVHLHELDGDRFATLDVGVHFLAVPQPAGHHPRLYLHSNDWSGTAGIVNAPLGSTGGYLTMNTVSDDPSDTGKPAIGRSEVMGVNSGVNFNSVGVSRFSWSACLDPGLRLGLDFDLGRQGTIEVPISTTRPLPGATLTGRLLHLGPGEAPQYCSPYEYQDRTQTVLAELDFGSQDLDANGRATYATTIQALPDADYLAADEGALMVLELTLTAVGMPVGGSGGANLEPGTWMELPLNEYHEAVTVVLPTPDAAPVAGFVPQQAPGKDAPGPALPVVLAALAVIGLLRRRQ